MQESTNNQAKGQTMDTLSNTIILAEGRGDYITDIHWQRDGKADILGGKREDAIRYTAAEAQEVIEALVKANGRGYSAEVV